jgi:hypothetical protein
VAASADSNDAVGSLAKDAGAVSAIVLPMPQRTPYHAAHSANSASTASGRRAQMGRTLMRAICSAIRSREVRSQESGVRITKTVAASLF